MKTTLIRIVLLTALLLAPLLSGPRVAAQAGPAASQGVSPAGLLNPDGTLNLDGNFSGSLDLRGFNVQMDPQRGPVFGQSGSGQAAPSSVASGQWASLGGGLQALNNTVFAIAVSGADVYIGGDFTDANGIPAADYVVKWNGSTWSALGSNGTGDGSLTNTVYAIAVSGSNVYVGGYFVDVNNNGAVLTAADKIAKWDGANWSALGSDGAGNGSINTGVNAIAVSGSDVYVGGQFTNVINNGTVLTAADFVAKWDGANWSALGSNGAGNGSVPNPVNALAIMGTDLYVGGNFAAVNNNGTPLNAADCIAKWDGANWSALGSNGAGDGALNGAVNALAVSGTDLYVGGNFTDVHNGILAVHAADYIAKWNGSNWSALASNGAGDGALNNDVNAIAVNGSTVFVGGAFTDVNNKGTLLTAADYVARFDASTRVGGQNWSALGSNGSGDGAVAYYVYAVALSGSNVVVGGDFNSVNNNGSVLSAANYIATWNGLNWSAPASTNSSGALSNYQYNPRVLAVAVSGTDVYVGGTFINVENGAATLNAADYIAKWDGSNWSALGNNGAGDGSLNGTVDALAVSGSNLYVGGVFGDVNNGGTVLTAADRIAKWDGSNWSALGNNGATGGSISGGTVYALAVIGSNLYVGGSFIDVNNNGTSLTSADYIARWDGANWFSLLGDGVSNGSLNNDVNAIAVSGSNVYVGGSFTNVNNGGTLLPAADFVAKWDGGNWSALGSDGAGDGSIKASVDALAVSGSIVYVGGGFTDVNNGGTVLNAADYIAKWDGANWSALGRNGAGNGALISRVFAIAVSGSNVYAGGQFYNVNNNGTPLPAGDYIAKWNGTVWSALGSNGAGNGALNADVNAIVISGSTLYAGGDFTDVSNNGTRLTAGDFLAAYGIGIPLQKIFLPLLRR